MQEVLKIKLTSCEKSRGFQGSLEATWAQAMYHELWTCFPKMLAMNLSSAVVNPILKIYDLASQFYQKGSSKKF